jgi:glucan phosphoethanolaminetransferase (alkaline phosphatase superfamily)
MAISTALKVKFSVLSALIFFLVANPVTFRFVNSIIPGVANNGCPTAFGFMLHTFVFFLVSFAVMLFPKDPE